eukprot:c23228_g1_i1 orf=158-601(-)
MPSVIKGWHTFKSLKSGKECEKEVNCETVALLDYCRIDSQATSRNDYGPELVEDDCNRVMVAPLLKYDGNRRDSEKLEQWVGEMQSHLPLADVSSSEGNAGTDTRKWYCGMDHPSNLSKVALHSKCYSFKQIFRKQFMPFNFVAEAK